MPSRNTVLNCSDLANRAPKETVTFSSRSPPLVFPAIEPLPSTHVPGGILCHAEGSSSPSKHKGYKSSNQAKKRAAKRRLRKLTGRRQTEWTGHSDPKDWITRSLARKS